MIHVIKHDMDHNMDLNYRRKIRPVSRGFTGQFQESLKEKIRKYKILDKNEC